MNQGLDLSVYKETLLFLVTAGVVAPLFFRLRVSPVLGYLLAGVALGPYGLGSLDLKAPWLNALAINVDAIDRIAAFGVVALLFTMGLELSFERLRRMRYLVFGLGLAQVVVTTLILGTAAWRLGLPPLRAGDRGGAVDVLDRDRHSDAGREQTASFLGRAGELGGAAVSGSGGRAPPGDDRRVLSRRRARIGWELISTLVAAGLGLAALVFFGRLALRPFFRFVAETKSPEFFMAACLLVVLGDGLAAAASHLSMALGAFVAGCFSRRPNIAARSTDDRAVPRPAARALLRVGRRGINPAFIVARPGLVLGLAAALIAIKGLTLFALGRGFRLPPRASAEMSLLLGPGGEFGFVMIGVALAGGLIDRALATALISAVAISMLVIPGLAKLGARIGSPRGAADARQPEFRRRASVPRHHRRLRPRRRVDRRHARPARDPVHRGRTRTPG